MATTKFGLREQFVANFQTALEQAGMQYAYGTDETKPRYWRGQVDNVDEDLFLLFSASEPTLLEEADNKLYREELYIDGQLFTRSGYTDSDFQDLAEEIEKKCKALNIFISWTGEGRDNSIDTESPLYYVNFEAKQRLLLKEN